MVAICTPYLASTINMNHNFIHGFEKYEMVQMSAFERKK